MQTRCLFHAIELCTLVWTCLGQSATNYIKNIRTSHEDHNTHSSKYFRRMISWREAFDIYPCWWRLRLDLVIWLRRLRHFPSRTDCECSCIYGKFKYIRRGKWFCDSNKFERVSVLVSSVWTFSTQNLIEFNFSKSLKLSLISSLLSRYKLQSSYTQPKNIPGYPKKPFKFLSTLSYLTRHGCIPPSANDH